MFTPLTEQQYNNAIKAGFTPQQIITNEQKRKTQNTPPPSNYFQRVGGEYAQAGSDVVSGIKEAAGQIQQGNILGGIKTAALRTVGGIAESAFAPITEAPVVKPILEAAGTGIAHIPGVDVIVQKATELAKKHPEAAKDLKNIVDIATLGVGTGAAEATGTALEKSGVALEKSGVAALDAAKQTFAQDLVKPLETASVKLEQVGRTTEAGGLFKKDIVTPTALETQSAKEVAQIPGISAKNTFQQNFNLVRDYNVGQAKQLEADVAKYNFGVPHNETITRLSQVSSELKQSPLIVGDAAKTANRLIDGAKKFINANEPTGSGLLKARKEYDSWVLDQRPKAFDAKAENAFSIANDAVRNTMNTMLDEGATNLGVKDSLRKQFALYKAMENIAPKAAQEANTPLLRAFEKVGKVLGVKNRLVQAVATAVGIGGLGAAATFAPAVAALGGTGFLIYRAGKLVMKPEVRIALGQLLQTSGHLLNPTDRKILQDAINTYRETPNKQGGFISIGGKTFKMIDESTKNELIQSIDYLRTGKTTPKIEDTVSKLAQKYNISQDLPNSAIADKFQNLIEMTKTK